MQATRGGGKGWERRTPLTATLSNIRKREQENKVRAYVREGVSSHSGCAGFFAYNKNPDNNNTPIHSAGSRRNPTCYKGGVVGRRRHVKQAAENPEGPTHASE